MAHSSSSPGICLAYSSQNSQSSQAPWLQHVPSCSPAGDSSARFWVMTSWRRCLPALAAFIFRKIYELAFFGRWEEELAVSTFPENRPGKLLMSKGVSLECLGHKSSSFLCLGSIFGKCLLSAHPSPGPHETTEWNLSQDAGWVAAHMPHQLCTLGELL
jgi:hypothetical protein